VNANGVEESATALGREIFAAIRAASPSALRKSYWASRLMEWSMRDPDFKVNSFRLVDVLPTLRSNRAVAEHVHEYLSDVARKRGGIANVGVRVAESALARPVAALAVRRSVEQMAALFIAGENPRAALHALHRLRINRLAFTVDLLGEFSVSEREADAYLARYLEALAVFGKEAPRWKESGALIDGHPGESTPVCISVKLTALYSQCSPLNFDRSVEVLSGRLSQIVRKAREVGALVYVDAEDSASNPIIFETFRAVFGSDEFASFPYPGIVLQAYARATEGYLAQFLDFARSRGRPIAVRLVKGAYWDFETTTSAQNHWESPLFGVKESSDANYEKLTRVLIDNRELVLPAFGSHNIRSVAYACAYARSRGLSERDFELQMLYGMAEPIARAFAAKGYLVRLYVPIGDMIVGMGYLVRRLLENTSNESFLRHTFFEEKEIDALLRPPSFKD
jgi:RHH-type proline utilization regulon transcriptional repressor/proline dehydrogenase/delta 1-pyrroline-5-carboxylate dehydrogenase